MDIGPQHDNILYYTDSVYIQCEQTESKLLWSNHILSPEGRTGSALDLVVRRTINEVSKGSRAQGLMKSTKMCFLQFQCFPIFRQDRRLRYLTLTCRVDTYSTWCSGHLPNRTVRPTQSFGCVEIECRRHEDRYLLLKLWLI
jgi:hypothetical protein